MIEKEIKKALREAVFQQDWEKAQMLENLLKTHRENVKLQVETKIMETNEQLARLNMEKVRVEIDKMFLDRKFSFANLIFGSGLILGILNLVKDLPVIKQFFNK